MTFDSCFVYDEGHIRKISRVEQGHHVSVQVRLRHLHSNVKHPDVVEGELTIVAAEDVELALHDVCCVSAARTRSVVAGLYFLPMTLLDIVHVDVVHPVCAIVPAEVVDF